MRLRRLIAPNMRATASPRRVSAFDRFTSNNLSYAHPLGMNLRWTAADAVISAAAIINLSASSKTARSFAYHVSRQSAAEEPVGFLQVSQMPELLEPVPGKLGAELPTNAVRYDQVGSRWSGLAG
ncbi:hypothetical protein BDW59DRAFT_71902 [Aspergillus cavernicola]|uniref:Uncharacterized protein n=1 Tax=Aspergillus cavernicola TaxID=176166 RepID=A0ABR4IFJ0_9EURO